MAIDPGTQKCGVAVVNSSTGLLRRMIVADCDLLDTVQELSKIYPISLIVVGDRTSGKRIRTKITALGFPVAIVDEDRSTLEGRYRYLKENRKGLAKFLPIGLRSPDKPFDDYVAEVLAERYFKANADKP